jgi:hypothetical protein
MRRPILIIVIGVALTTVSSINASEPVWPSTVQGYGLSVDGAKKHAVTEAVRQIQEYARKSEPPLEHWQVTEEYVEKNVLLGPGEPGPDVTIGDTEKGKSWILRLKAPNAAEFAVLERQAIGAHQLAARQVVSADRLFLTGWIFGGALALLGLTMAYVHLAERK